MSAEWTTDGVAWRGVGWCDLDPICPRAHHTSSHPLSCSISPGSTRLHLPTCPPCSHRCTCFCGHVPTILLVQLIPLISLLCLLPSVRETPVALRASHVGGWVAETLSARGTVCKGNTKGVWKEVGVPLVGKVLVGVQVRLAPLAWFARVTTL